MAFFRALALCLLWLASACALAQGAAMSGVSGQVARAQNALPMTAATPRIGIMVMQPGEIFWERFGHDSVLVADPQTREAISYNFGFFDPDEPDFIPRFVRGDMRYRLAAVPYDLDLVMYREEGRGVSVKWLDLDDAQARGIAAALAENALPENAYYRYDYFKDNCSTRVRDAIDRALGGALQKQVQGRSQGLTWRSEAVRLASPATWMWLGFDIGLGPAADQPMTLWEQAFVPRRLSDILDEARNSAGRPLVVGRQQILPHRIAPEPDDFEQRWWWWGFSGIAIAVVLAWLGQRRPRMLAALAMPFWTIAGVIGALLLFLWLGTEHRMAWGNHNLLLLNPVAWLALPGAWQVVRGRGVSLWFARSVMALALLALAGLFLHWLPVQPQRNAHWIALLLPIHAALAWTFTRQRRGS